MSYQFYIVGKKDSDCYVVHDAREGMGGKACASKYTLMQLVGNGYSVCGLNKDAANGSKSLSVKDISIMTLQGTKAVFSGTFPNVPDTKRSLSTFIKGIRRTKEEIIKAKLAGEKRGETIQNKKAKVDKTVGEIVAFFKEYVAANYEKGRFTLAKAVRVYNYQLPNDERIEELEQLFDKDGKPVSVYYCREKDIVVSKDKLLKKYDEIISSFNLTEKNYIKHGLKSGGTPKEIIEYVFNTTSKPIKYTCGFKYRHPTTYEVPIPAKEAVRLFKSQWNDVVEYDDYIDLNTYSDTDMW